MDVGGHQAPGLALHSLSGSERRQQIQGRRTVGIAKEDRQGAHAPLDHMVRQVWEHDTGEAGHTGSLRHDVPTVKGYCCILSPEFLGNS
jgi:hypothetical protein